MAGNLALGIVKALHRDGQIILIQLDKVAAVTGQGKALPLVDKAVQGDGGLVACGNGASIVDSNRCIGCGLCTTKCEFDAIHLSRDLPEASTMVKAEDKLKAIAPYMVKRQIKILRNKNK